MNATLVELLAQRDALEIEAMAITSELTSPGPNGEPPAGVKDPLVDAEGYPRGDIDIYEVRRKRQRLSVINTDHKELMKKLEKELQNNFAELPPSQPSSSKAPAAKDTLRPIAKLDQILPDSPAAAAGIMEGDMLLRMGHVTSKTNNAMREIPKLVGDNVNKALNVEVLRGIHVVELSLTPAVWGGRGLLGCHLSPL